MLLDLQRQSSTSCYYKVSPVTSFLNKTANTIAALCCPLVRKPLIMCGIHCIVESTFAFAER